MLGNQNEILTKIYGIWSMIALNLARIEWMRIKNEKIRSCLVVCDLCVCYVRHQRLLLEIGLSSWSGLHSDQSDHPTEPLQVKVGLIGMDGWVVDIIISIDKAFSSSHQVILLEIRWPVITQLNQYKWNWTRFFMDGHSDGLLDTWSHDIDIGLGIVDTALSGWQWPWWWWWWAFKKSESVTG